MAKFKWRHIWTSVPFIDELRTAAISFFFTAGIDFFDNAFPVTRVMTASAKELLASQKPALLTIYHGRIIGMLHIVQTREDRKKVTLLISEHRDGEMIARISKSIGFSIARGSASFRAVQGARQLLAAARAGQSPMLTVDGPRGPVYKVKTAIIRMAEMTGLPMLPFVCQGRKSHFFWGWDKMMGCYYGSPMLYMIGDPIYVPANLSTEEREHYRLKLETAMESLRTMTEKYWQN
jgi:lysophospholipid acyltransferase (LPLAT)-like uncharacterized protein